MNMPGSVARLPVPQTAGRLPVPQTAGRLPVPQTAGRLPVPTSNNTSTKKKKKAKGDLTPDKLKDMTQEELDELLASFAGSGEESILDQMKSATQGNDQNAAMQDLLDKYASSLATPEFSFRDTQTFRAPGFFNG
jgi:hypothetical protein